LGETRCRQNYRGESGPIRACARPLAILGLLLINIAITIPLSPASRLFALRGMSFWGQTPVLQLHRPFRITRRGWC